MKKGFFIYTILLLFPALLSGLGQTEESDYKEVSGTDNWEYEVPLEGKEPGVYNLLIRAKDKANNETFAGPFDIIVDPESDLPLVSITNPISLMRVGGTLNVVGTARDDDGIEKVLIKVDEGEYLEATGKEFWSFSLSSDLYQDGQHTITAKAIDINGLEGKESFVIYNQDTLKPDTSIIDYSNGVIFSGKVQINGMVLDANEISNIELSIDNQETYKELNFKKDKTDDFYLFNFDIDTKKLNDGPNIYWIKSSDKTGSVAYTPFLFFVDNIGPVINVLDPGTEELLNGVVSVSGKITDEIGIKTFKYFYDEIEGDIELNKGNPYWTQKIDFLNEKKSKVRIKFVSEDTSGNITELNYDIVLDKESDKPILQLNHPQSGFIYKNGLLIEGTILDDDLIDGIEIKIDNNEPTFIKTFNTFSKKIDSLSTGPHKINIKAKDINGISSDSIDIPFEIDLSKPEIIFSKIITNENEISFYPGIKVVNDQKYSLQGIIKSGNRVDSLKYKIGDGEFFELLGKKGETLTEFNYNIDINENFKYGLNNIFVVATDSYGNITESYTQIFVKNYSIINDNWGIYQVNDELNQNVILKETIPYELFFIGPQILSVKTSTENDIIKIENNNNIIKIYGLNEGFLKDQIISVKTEKGTFESKAISFIFDKSNPKINLITPKIDTVQSSTMSLSGDISELSLKSLQYKFSNQTEFTDLKWTLEDSVNKFSTTISIPESTEESLTVELKAIDSLGNTSLITRSFKLNNNIFIQTLTQDVIDSNTGSSSDVPVLKVNLPLNNQVFYGEPVVSGFARDDDSIKSIKISEITENGKSITVDSKGLFDISLTQFGEGKKVLNIYAIDKNGVLSKPKKISYSYINKKNDISINKIIEDGKESDYVIGSKISVGPNSIITGKITSLNQGEITYELNGDLPKKVSILNNEFQILLPKNLSWGRNDIKLSFTDNLGNSSSKKSFFYIVDKMNTTNIKDSSGIYFINNNLKSNFINITNTDLNGIFLGREIKSIRLETESKNGKIPETLIVKNIGNRILISAESSIITDKIRIVVTTIDSDEYKSDFYQFIKDDTSPELTLNTLTDNFIKNEVILSGSIKDDIKISNLSFSLNNGVTWEEIEFTEPEKPKSKETYTSTFPSDEIKIEQKIIQSFIFNKKIDFSNMKDGGYTILVKVTDSIGNETVEKRTFIKDNTNPILSLFIPGEDEINGVITLIGKTKDNIEISNISYSKDEVNFIEIGRENVFNFKIDFGEEAFDPQKFVIRSTDMAGNFTDLYPAFNINNEKDKPVIEIQTPILEEVIRNDFIVSGMAFDDDGIAEIFYSLDGSDYVKVAENENNFSVKITLDEIENNQHTITVKAVDILGVESDIKTSTFWVSKEEPTSILLLPKIEETKRDIIKLVGQSFDENGIDSVYVSLDNGVSYQKAIGTTDWNYTFNTKNIKDGTYSLFVKAIDKLETEGFYSTLINVDNTPPELIINQPVDGDVLSEKIIFSGRSMDNIGLKDVLYKIYTHTSNNNESIIIAEGNLGTKGIFNIDIPLEGFDIGDYNIELIAYDLSNNRSISTRNFTVTEVDNAGELELLFPQPGSTFTTNFDISGKIIGVKKVSFVECYIDDKLFSEIKVNEFNYFNLKVNTLNLLDGEHTLKLKANLLDGQVYETPTHEFYIKNSGSWLNIVNMQTGSNISGRPFLKGESGFIQNEDILEENKVIPTLVEVSLDNGQIFETATGTNNWEFRIETWKYEDGLTPILVRSTYSNGDTKTNKIVVNIDRSNPEVSILEDLENGSFNDSIKMSGIASDANGITDISVVLREGSKSNYEVPGLFQGMFLDVETGFGKVYGVGLGLTFFDDNVKLQVTVGETRTSGTDARIKGLYYGGKLIANIFTLDYGQIIGPDFENLSSSLGVGASFTNKTVSVSDEDTILWYSAIVGQFEFIKLKFDNDYLSSVSFYIDFEATLISSENSGGFFPRLGLGTRLTLF